MSTVRICYVVTHCPSGVCDCAGGWFGGDCGVDITKPPTVTKAQFGCKGFLAGLGTCSTIMVLGDSFIGTGTLKCKFTEISVSFHDSYQVLMSSQRRELLQFPNTVMFKVMFLKCKYIEFDIVNSISWHVFSLLNGTLQWTASKWSLGTKTTVVTATFISINYVSCTAPSAGSWAVSVTIDGKQFSLVFPLVNFDTRCYSCQNLAIGKTTGSCSQKVRLKLSKGRIYTRI